MGPSGQVDGFVLRVRLLRVGFQIGPGVGETMAELIDTGSTAIPLDAFSIRRFTTQPAARSSIVTS
jgi:sarcosine oxidase subunit beta